jgi:ABC-type multidrug transport system ATPase subunit
VLPIKGGNARLDGSELSAWHPDDLGQYIGYVPQDVQLFPGTVKENIARMARDTDPDEVIEAAKLAGVHNTIVNLPEGYDTDIGDAGAMLSAGQRQHVALARAFFGNPSLLVLDEPNSNLDSVSEAALVRALATAKERGMTIIVITHRPSVLEAADKLLLLREGSVELFGPRDKVIERMQQPTLGHQHRAQIAVVKEPAEDGDPTRTPKRQALSGDAHQATTGPVATANKKSGSAGHGKSTRRSESSGPTRPKASPAELSTKKQQEASGHVEKPPAEKPESQTEERLVETTIVRADDTIVRADKAVVRSERK